jgi:hypothetical protein
MASSPDSLQARLDQLEANVRRWQRISRFWVWGLLAFIAAMLVYNPPGGRLAETPYQTLSARQVMLMDGQGNVRARLSLNEDGAPFLWLEAGQGAAMLAVDHDGAAMLVLERNGQVVGRLP